MKCNISSKYKHLLHVLCFCCFLILFQFLQYKSSSKTKLQDFNTYEEYGSYFPIMLYFFKYLTLLALPQVVFNFCGLTFFNAFVNECKLTNSPIFSPFICIRIVTKGNFPNLIKSNIQRNLSTCSEVGLTNYIIQIVTDKSLNIETSQQVVQIIVPSNYSTKTKALYKARALQYCWESNVNILQDDEWIIHLDEETYMTPNSLRGILNFIMDGQHHFGQGVITYGNNHMVNWFTTLADSFRVADDFGKLRFQFKMFKRPLFGWKGSYVVTRAGAERSVSYDFGPDGSVSEDCFFSMMAFQNNYKFGFIDGEMWEQSPFTLWDFIQQRKRWIQGIFLVVHSFKIPIRYKLLLSCSFYSWLTLPLTTCNLLLEPLFPVPNSIFLNSIIAVIGAVNMYMYIFGVLKTFSISDIGTMRMALYELGAIVTLPCSILIETFAVFWALIGKKHNFYIVHKELPNLFEHKVFKI